MNDERWLLDELERWERTGDPEPEAPSFREALASSRHQDLASRIRQALRDAPPHAVAGILPPPC